MSRLYFLGNGKKEDLQSNYAQFRLNIDEPINLTEQSNTSRTIEPKENHNLCQKQSLFSDQCQEKKVEKDEEIIIDVNQCLEVSQNVLENSKTPQLNDLSINCISQQELPYSSQKNYQTTQKNIKKSKLSVIQSANSKTKEQFRYIHSFANKISNKSIFFSIKLRGLVQKFTKRLQQNLESKRYSQFNYHQSQIINDKAFIFEQSQKQLKNPLRKKIESSRDQMQRIISRFHSLLESCDNTVINPEVWFIFLWNMIILFITLIQLFVVSVRISFDTETLPSFIKISIFAYILEILLGLNTGVYKQGVLLLSRKQILKIYVQKKLLKRVFIIVLLYLSHYQKYLQLVVFLRISIIDRLFKKIEQQLNVNFQCYTYTKLLKLICFLLAVAHFIACSFRLISLIESSYFNSQELWNYKIDSNSDSLFDNYINSVYWAVVTMATLGYGDIVPLTVYERLFVVFVVLASCGIFAYSINLIGELIRDMNKDKDKYKEQVQKLEFFIKQRNVSRNLRNKVIKSFQYNFKQQNMERETSGYFLSQMNSSVRQEVSLDLYLKILNSHKFFTLNFSPSLIKGLCDHIKEKTLFPEEYLYRKGDRSDKIFFLLEGQVTLILEDLPNTKLASYEAKNCLIGLTEFLSQQQRKESAKINTQTVVAYIEFDQFIKQTKILNQDYETYSFLKDNITLLQKYSKLGTRCYSCQSFDHQFGECQQIQYIPVNKKVIQNYNTSKNNLRIPFERRKKVYSWKNNLPIDIEKFICIQQGCQGEDKTSLKFNELSSIEKLNQIELYSISESNQQIKDQDSPYLRQINENKDFSPKKDQGKEQGILPQQDSFQFQQIYSSHQIIEEARNLNFRQRKNSKESPIYKGDLNSKIWIKKNTSEEDQTKTLSKIRDQKERNQDEQKYGNLKNIPVIYQLEENLFENQLQDNIPTKIIQANRKKLTINNFKLMQGKEIQNFLEIDKTQQYEIYFAHNNINKVLAEYDIMRKSSKQYKIIRQKQMQICKINSLSRLSKQIQINKAIKTQKN